VSARKPEDTLRYLDWTVIRRLDGLLQGDYRTLFRGFGLDLADLREYHFGDDVRFIDWNVTARLQVPYVREYLEDREVAAWFLLDISPSQDFGTVRTLKRGLLIDVVAVLARLLTRRGNRVGAILYSDRVDAVVPPLGGRIQVLRIIRDLQSRPRQTRTSPTDLTVLLEAALRMVRRRSIVFVVSDFISTPGWEGPLALLSRRHEVIGIRPYDPLEMDLPDIGPVVLEDAETGEQLYVDTHDRKLRERFARAARRRLGELESAFARAGVDLMHVSTAEDLVAALVRFTLLRKRRTSAPAALREARPRGLPRLGKPAGRVVS
jgi:uncharacterized protein (DUF58 family)